MSNKDNQSKSNRIYHKPSKTWFEVTPEQFKEYDRWRTRIRKRMQSRGCCVCPRHKWWLCDGLCEDCEFRAAGDTLSLDKSVSNGEGDEVTLMDTLVDPAPLIENIMSDEDELKDLFARLKELMPEATEIGKYRQDDLTDEAISKLIGIKRTTYRSRLSKVMKQLAAEFPDRF